MEKARCNTELYSNLRAPLNNVKPSNFWGSHQSQIGLPSCNLYMQTIIFLPLIQNQAGLFVSHVCNHLVEYVRNFFAA